MKLNLKVKGGGLMIIENKKHYVYMLISLIEDKYYIGARSCICSIDEDTYMGSSRVMTKEDKSNCDKLILKEFSTRKEAIAYEIELHESFDVSNNQKFWNVAKQTSTGFDTTGREIGEKERKMRSEIQKKRFKNGHHCTGVPLTPEHKAKISAAGKGRKHSNETRSKIQSAHACRATKHWKFEPWWYKTNNVVTEVYDKTIRQFADELGVSFNVVKDRFKSKFIGKELTRGKLKGYTFGRIK